MSKTRNKNKKLTKAEQKDFDLSKRLDSIVESLGTLHSQNKDLKDEFSYVKERLDTVEGSSNQTDVLGSQTEPETEPEEEITFNADKKLRKSVNERLRGLLNSESSDSDDEIQAIKSRATKKNLKKSGKLKTAQHKISRYVDWPHMYVFRRDCNDDGVKYDSLSQMEFMNGYLMLMKNEKEPRVRSHMYEHLINLTSDASEYPWSVVRNFHSIVLCMMESKRLEWHHTSVIQDLRRQYVWATPTIKTSSSASDADISNVKACPEFQTGKCQKSASIHNGLSHVCAYCLRTAKKSCLHAENDCRRKEWKTNNASFPSKNGQGGEQPT